MQFKCILIKVFVFQTGMKYYLIYLQLEMQNQTWQIMNLATSNANCFKAEENLLKHEYLLQVPRIFNLSNFEMKSSQTAASAF